MQKVLVVSPHPDDEAIGCGGVICKHVAEGDEVHVVFLTSGEKGGHGRAEDETKQLREREALEAAKVLGTASSEFWREADKEVPVNDSTIDRLFKKIEDLQPSVIYVTHENEEHPDHKAAAAIVKQAVSRIQNDIMILGYEVWTPIQQMDHIVDISDYVTTKERAIQAHKSQCDVLKFDEAILALNRYRGEMHSWPGGDYAEVFTLLKIKV
ncbi:MAG TPA: PIG-L deacetylase family protein [Flavipsychrobacter sp.]|nr:PIG-L deacetylase family protein [Flavipsychrobacter sp.]